MIGTVIPWRYAASMALPPLLLIANVIFCESFSFYGGVSISSPSSSSSSRHPLSPDVMVDPQVASSRRCFLHGQDGDGRRRKRERGAIVALHEKYDEDDMYRNLRQRANRQARQYSNLFNDGMAPRGGRVPSTESVHIILYRPDTDAQCVHTIEYPMGSGYNWILAFEDADDCSNFANELRSDNDAELFSNPTPVETLFEPFARHCTESGTHYVVVPTGFGLTPPQANVADGGGLEYYDDDDDADDDDDDDGDDDNNNNNNETGYVSRSDESTSLVDDVNDTGAWG